MNEPQKQPHKTGFQRSLEGKQEWPPTKLVVKKSKDTAFDIELFIKLQTTNPVEV